MHRLILRLLRLGQCSREIRLAGGSSREGERLGGCAVLRDRFQIGVARAGRRWTCGETTTEPGRPAMSATGSGVVGGVCFQTGDGSLSRSIDGTAPVVMGEGLKPLTTR